MKPLRVCSRSRFLPRAASLLVITVPALLYFLPGCATSTAPTPSSAIRAPVRVDPNFPLRYAETRGFSLGEPQALHFLEDGSALLFLRSGPRNPEQNLYEFDTATGKERLVLTAERLLKGKAETLSREELAQRERMRMTATGITSYKVSRDGTRVLVGLGGTLFLLRRASGTVRELRSDYGYAISPTFSPDGEHVAAVRDGALFVQDLRTGRERQVTRSSTNSVTYGISEFVAQEEMGRYEGYWWSPDSTRLVYQKTDTLLVEKLYIADPVHPGQPPQRHAYPRAGTANAKVRLGIVSTNGGATQWIKWDREKYPYVVNVRWKEHAPLSVLVQNRRQTEMALLEVEADTGTTRVLLVERDEAWLNIDQAMPKWLPDGTGFLWTTERNGGWQLELRKRDGTLERALTPVSLGYKGLASLNADGQEAVVYGSPDPVNRFLYSVFIRPDEGDAEPFRLSQEDGYHTAIYSSDHRFHVHRRSSLEGTTLRTVYDEDGAAVGAIESKAERNNMNIHVEVLKVGERPSFYAAIIRPDNFRSSRRYPVIESVYGGPLSTVVSIIPRRYIHDQWLANQGFIVVRIDGRGTPFRGREWERAIRGDLIDVALQDHTRVLTALGRRFSEMDLSRVGIVGWSFGGYFAAMAVTRFPDVYHAAVAGAPVVDWRDYDTHYTERYLGLPEENERGYRASNVLNYATYLRRPLLIIHGTTDDNVYFGHSLKLSDALFRAGVDHSFLPLVNFTHMVDDPIAVSRRTAAVLRFFEEHLRAGAR